jgi:hypothetical protein
MNRAEFDPAIRIIIAEMRQRLEEAAGIAKAADLCVEAGRTDKAIEIALEIEQLCYEASRLLDSSSLLARITRGARLSPGLADDR